MTAVTASSGPAGARVGFDVSSLAAPRTGIGRYAYELLDALWRVGGEAAPVAVGNCELPAGSLPASAGAAAVPGPGLGSRGAWTFGLLPWWLPRHRFALFHGPSYYAPVSGRVPTVVTIHDLSVLAVPETHPPGRVLRARAALRLVARHAAAIIVPSAFTAGEVRRRLGIADERLHVVAEGVAGTFLAPSPPGAGQLLVARLGLEPGFLLAVGTVEPRKRLGLAIEAIARLSATGEGPQLVVAGRPGPDLEPLRARIRVLGLGDRVRFLGHVPDGELRALMDAAGALVYPSGYEGFGLPVVEAMAAGLPVIAAPGGAVEEVAAGAALLVDPVDTDALALAMHRVRADGALAAWLREAGRARAGAFSWDDAALETLRVYDLALRRTGATA